MGTSTDYSAPPNWGGLKGDVTRAASSSVSESKAAEILGRHIGTSGGAAAIAGGRGQLGAGTTARTIAKNLGSFIQQVASTGLAEALRANGLEQLVGKSAHETLLGIVSLCGGSDGSIDSVDARNALSRTMDELCKDTITADEVEAALGNLTDGPMMVDLLMSFFGNYLYEQFCRVFFGQLIQKHGEQRANSFLRDIFDYIKSRLRNTTHGRDVQKIDWFGQAGEKLAGDIMRDTLAVFET